MGHLNRLVAQLVLADYKAQLLSTLTDPEWKAALDGEFKKPYFDKICDALHQSEKVGKQGEFVTDACSDST
jgi:hypothetical protein